MSALSSFSKPVIVVHEDICRSNIRKMANKAKDCGIVFRPHFKTHQSRTIGRWYREEGVKSITVSSVSMAEYFEADGWNDITIAFPFNRLEADSVNDLAGRISVNIIVSSTGSAENASASVKNRTGVFIETDTGYPRSGIKSDNFSEIEKCLDIIGKNKNLVFRGFLSHFGHSYLSKGGKEISGIWNYGISALNTLKKSYPGSLISAGDTPCCSIVSDLSGADEIRPGNFAFYDLMQTGIGSCKDENVAIAIYCPVVAVYPSDKKAVLYCGAVHLSKDSLTIDGKKVFGKIGMIKDNERPEYIQGCYINSLSQEHGVINMPDGLKLSEGMVVAVMPVHSCLAVSCMKKGIINPGYSELEIFNF